MQRLTRLAVGLGQVVLAAAIVCVPIALGFWARDEVEPELEAMREPAGKSYTRLATLVSDFDNCYQASAVLGNGNRIVVHSGQQFPRELNGKQVLVSFSDLDECWDLLSTNPESATGRFGRRPGWNGPGWNGPPGGGTYGRPAGPPGGMHGRPVLRSEGRREL